MEGKDAKANLSICYDEAEHVNDGATERIHRHRAIDKDQLKPNDRIQKEEAKYTGLNN